MDRASRDSEADYRDPKTRREPVAGRVRLDPPDPSTARHAPQCEFAAETDPSTLRVLLKVTERDGYWWVECGSCEYGWQVPHYAVA